MIPMTITGRNAIGKIPGEFQKLFIYSCKLADQSSNPITTVLNHGGCPTAEWEIDCSDMKCQLATVVSLHAET
jgi:hypothetical protein